MKIQKICVKARRRIVSCLYGFWVPPYDGMMDERRCRFLYDLIIRHLPKNGLAVEIGVFKGCSTAWVAAASRRKKARGVVAIDLFTGTPSWGETWDTYPEFMKRLERNAFKDLVRVKRGDSHQIALSWKKEEEIDLLHIDGDHSEEGACRDVTDYVPLLARSGIIVLDDHDALHPGVLKAGQLLGSLGFEELSCVRGDLMKGGGSMAFQRKRVV